MAYLFGKNIKQFSKAINKASLGKIILWASPSIEPVAIISWKEYDRLTRLEKELIYLKGNDKIMPNNIQFKGK